MSKIEEKEIELKPCPFCPGGGSVVASPHKVSSVRNTWIGCQCCEVFLESATNEPFDSLVNRWNSRPLNEAEKQKWNVIERDGLPEENGTYLAQCDNGKMRVVGFYEISNSDTKCFHFPYGEHSHNSVVAWRELPEAYKE